MGNRITSNVIFVLLWFALSLNGQDQYSFELRAGTIMPTEKLGNADLDFGWCIEGVVDLRMTSFFGPYLGWGWNRFSGEETLNKASVQFGETGFLFGLGFHLPIGESLSGYYIRLGGVYNFVKTKSEAPVFTEVFGDGLGWQAGFGLNIFMGNNWQVRPGIKYKALSRDIMTKPLNQQVDLNYFSMGLGIAKIF